MVIDRRVARTRTALFETLITLIRDRDYEDITVQDILQAANVGRSTFYSHFKSKDDLLDKSLDRLKLDLLEVGANRAWSPSRAMFEHVAGHSDLQLKLASGRGGLIVNEAIDAVLASLLDKWIPNRMPEGLPRELVIRFLVSSLNVTVRWWLERRPNMTAAQADGMFKLLVSKSLPAEILDPLCQVR